jgi:PKD repeat protein
MKKLSFLLILLPLFGLNLQAQVSYSISDYAAVGDTFVFSSVQNGLGSFDFSLTGSAYSWNYDSLDIRSQEVLRIAHPDNTGYYTTWYLSCILGLGNIFTCPGIWDDMTDIAISDLDTLAFGGVQLSEGYTFYKTSGSSVEATISAFKAGFGGINLPFVINYEDVDSLYQFPLTYQAKDSSNARLSLDLTASGIPLAATFQHKRVNEVDGWGSLTTPFATYPQVLRMKTLIYNNDTTVISGNPLSVPVTEVKYRWFAPGYGQPVFEASGTVAAGIELITGVKFLDSLRCLEPNASFFFLPPVAFVDSITGLAEISFYNQSGNSDQYYWDFGDGTSSTQNEPTHQYGPGLYMVSLIACNNRCQPAICDTITLPVTVINQYTPVSIFSAFPSPACLGDTVFFTNNAINAQSYEWNFGDGSATSTEESPYHVYQTADSFEVTLIAINNGSRDTTTETIVVAPNPTPSLGQDTIFMIITDTLILDPGTFDTYFWSNGSQSPTFPIFGPLVGEDTLDIVVEVENEAGCEGRAETVVIIFNPLNRSDFKAAHLKVYPNPAQEMLTVELENGISRQARIQLVDLFGKVVQEKDFSGKSSQKLDVSSYPAGIYMLMIKLDGEEYWGKVRIK